MSKSLSPSCSSSNSSTHRFLAKCRKLKDFVINCLRKLDRRFDGGISFFFRHWGKTRFMTAMSKRLQMHGVEKLFFKSRKAFFYFFMFYLIRDTILYIIIPIFIAKGTGN